VCPQSSGFGDRLVEALQLLGFYSSSPKSSTLTVSRVRRSRQQSGSTCGMQIDLKFRM
ncbi:hypothetical protein RRG08_005781, partial [Elysia crispata]